MKNLKKGLFYNFFFIKNDKVAFSSATLFCLSYIVNFSFLRLAAHAHFQILWLMKGLNVGIEKTAEKFRKNRKKSFDMPFIIKFVAIQCR